MRFIQDIAKRRPPCLSDMLWWFDLSPIRVETMAMMCIWMARLLVHIVIAK